MNHDDILTDVMNIHNKNIVLEMSMGSGKTLCAMKLMERILKDCNLSHKALIVIPKLALINNWLKELEKWNMSHLVPLLEFTTYISLPKKYNEQWSVVCFDEAHHITERCFRSIEESLNRTSIPHLFLSATLSTYFKLSLSRTFPDLYVYNLPLKTAIENKILPDPTIILYPLVLDNTDQRFVYVKRQKGIKTVVPYQQRWPVIKNGNLSPHILCTQQQYYNLLCDDIEYLKDIPKLRKILSQKNIQRLKLLSDFKTDKVKNVLSILQNYRTLTFCNSIEQANNLSKHPIHSGILNWEYILEAFNNKEINHISTCDILSEGMNVVDCKICMFARINASEVALFQRLGRGLRHENPVIIIPYYIRTREEEIVKQEILPNFNTEKIFTIQGVNEIFKYVK